MNCEFKLVSSLEKCFFGKENFPATRGGSMLKNEVYSFQLLCSAEAGYYLTLREKVNEAIEARI